MLSDDIQNFAEQLKFEPEVLRSEKLTKYKHFIVVGMGGSRLAGDLIKAAQPELPLIIHSDYGLPYLDDQNIAATLVICNSFSGNTEETLDAYHVALAKKMPLSVVATGGKLLQLAAQDGVPAIEIPKGELEPRYAVGLMVVALLKLLGQDSSSLREFSLDADLQEQGQQIAAQLQGVIPLIYTSTRNRELGYYWKIMFNETSKIPAFCNRLPELCHNELSSFTRAPSVSALSDKFQALFLVDSNDHPQIQKRMQVVSELLQEKEIKYQNIVLGGSNRWAQIFNAVILANWVSYHLAISYGLDPLAIELVENFKKKVAI